MTDQHLITPPPDLVRQWMEAAGEYLPDEWYYEMNIATQAARWSADQELEACCAWAAEQGRGFDLELRAARRPQPKSLAEEALEAMQRMWEGSPDADDWSLIRRALGRLQELEGKE